MEDIIDIIVTETTNLIEITSQPTDEIIDVNIIDNREDITLNVTPTVVEININSLTGNFGVNWGEISGTLSSQTDLNTALGLKADLVGGKVPSSQLPSYVDDVVEVATYSALPSTGETGKIYVVLDTNLIYRWSGSAYIEIKDSSAVWGAITGTLSSQTDLQNALNAKFNNPTGDSTQYLNGAGTPVTFPIAGQAGTLVREVRNTTGATLTKGTIVYISGATGNKPTVSKALATGDSTSAQTFGLCQADIANNANGYVVCTGDIVGLDTSAISEGVQLYLSSTTAGTYTTTKQVAPAHLVYIGVVTRSHPTQGQIEVKIQNGYELDEIHDVLITSKANNDGLFYESSTSLWKNKSIVTVLGYTPQAQLNGTGFVKASGSTISYDNSTYALDSAVVKLTGTQTIAGVKTFSNQPVFNSSFIIKNTGSGSVSFGGNTTIYTSDDTFNVLVGTVASTTRGFSFLYATGFNPLLTLPSSDGTLALTSQLSSYLPLTGGTLTGALSGTSVSLSSSITATRIILSGGTPNTGLYFGHTDKVVLANYTVGGGLDFETNGGNVTMQLSSAGNLSTTGTLSATGATLTGALSGTSATFSGAINLTGTANSFQVASIFRNANRVFFGGDTGGYFFQNSANSATVLQIADTGAATFSSSVTAVGTTIKNPSVDGSTALISIRDTSDVYQIGYLNFNQNTDMMTLMNKQGYSASGISFGTNNTERMRITQSGNVGIGTTGSSWNAFTALDIGTNASIANYTDYTFLGVNTYYSTSNNWTYKNNGYGAAILLRKDDGAIQFSNFANGTAGATASFTERMRITSAGFLGVNQTNPSQRLDVSGAIRSGVGVSNGASIAKATGRTLYKVMVSSNYDAGGAVRGGEWNVLLSNEGDAVTNTTQIYVYNNQTATFSVSGGNLIINGLNSGNNICAVYTD
jgi:hypothetical protein